MSYTMSRYSSPPLRGGEGIGVERERVRRIGRGEISIHAPLGPSDEIEYRTIRLAPAATRGVRWLG